MRAYALSAIGADRPGIIAAVAAALVDHDVNVTDSRMGVLAGHFAMTLVVTAPDDADEAALDRDLRDVADRLGLHLALRPVEPAPAAPASEPSHVVTVHGADHPGILAAVAAALAEHGANVTDLQTRLAQDVWVMYLEATVPHPEAVEAALAAVAAEQGVAIAVRPVDADVL